MIKFIVLVLCVFFGLTEAQSKDESQEKRFTELQNLNWKETFFDSYTEPWQNRWFLDGERAVVRNSPAGLEYWSGPEAWNDTCHAVLWTKKSFSGDVKIEFEYTRLDTAIKFVNIIYIQATGSGEEGYDEDIRKWSEKRTVPSMSSYFLNMNTYHISFAAFGTKNENPALDYVRARRYMPSLKGLRGSELTPDYEKTGLFRTGQPHQITIIKRDQELFMQVKNSEQTVLFHWNNDKFPLITEGRIGLRHMYTRGALYRNFRVMVL